MFKLNMSEEIILDIKNGNFKNKLFSYSDSIFFDKLLDKIHQKNILIVNGFDNYLREEICFEVIRRFFHNNYINDLDFSVFNICSINDLDKLYLEDQFQIFYLDDFLGSISSYFLKFEDYIDKIVNSQNKALIVNMRWFLKDKIFCSKFYEFCENLNEYRGEINNNLFDRNFKIINTEILLNNYYNEFSHIDKFVLFSVLIDNLHIFDTWLKATVNYYLDKNMFVGNKDLQDLILSSLKKLEGVFISVYECGRFYIQDLIVENFLLVKFKDEVCIIKDLLNNISSYNSLGNIIKILQNLNIKLFYDKEDYENNLKYKLFEIICINNNHDIMELFNFTLNLYNVLGVKDNSIIQNLNTRIIYSNINIDSALNYFFSVKNFNEMLIQNEIFINKLLDLAHNYNFIREFEFYNYSFKYFLFVSEFCNLYGVMDYEEVADVKKYFNRLINMIFSNVNSYFTLEYFCLSNEIKQVLNDLRVLIKEFGVISIFSENIDGIFNDIKYKLSELLNNVVKFIPENEQEYYTLLYFKNELERNKEFIESIFIDISVEEILSKIMENICNFES